MYSYEARLRAVKLYLKLGRRMGATLRQLGYSNKNSLKAWCAEFEANRGLRKGYQRVKRRYTDEQKRKAVDHYVEQGHCLVHTIRCLGYPSRETLRAWVRELRPEFAKTISGSSSPVVPPFSLREAAGGYCIEHTRRTRKGGGWRYWCGSGDVV